MRLFSYTPGHVLDALSPVALVVRVTGDVLQVVHVRSNQHGPQLHEVAVRRVLHCTQEKTDVTLLTAAAHSWDEGETSALYPPLCPRGTASLSPSDLGLLPQCCCQSLQTECSPAEKQVMLTCHRLNNNQGVPSLADCRCSQLFLSVEQSEYRVEENYFKMMLKIQK